MLFAICFNLNQSKILSSGNGLNTKYTGNSTYVLGIAVTYEFQQRYVPLYREI